MTSRIDGCPVSSIVRRSMPMPSPAVGGMPTSSAAALLKTMAQMNYLSFESTSRAYRPTLRLSQLGGWVTSASYEDGPIQEAVRRIGRKLGETILLGTVTDIYVEIVDILRARQPLQYFTHVGSRVLLVHSGLGWPLLSELSDDEVVRIAKAAVAQPSVGLVGDVIGFRCHPLHHANHRTRQRYCNTVQDVR